MTAMSQAPAVPPRPTKSQESESLGASAPRVPPRPITKRFDRSISPNPDRFAPSPLHEGIPAKGPRSLRFNTSNAYHEHSDDPIDRSGSVSMPGPGEEGIEYSRVNDELRAEKQEKPADPEQTRTVANDLKLHAPKPSLPAQSAKERVQQVTRTDSDRAASFGIGRPTEERGPSREGFKKKPSTSFSAGSDGRPEFDDQGIPEIGQRVPMNPHLGDVQAPSPAPGSEAPKKHHTRKHSSRGGPPGSYGMHGHNVAPQDRLDKAYYEKHPELHEREHRTPIHDRQNDFAMSSKDLNQLVRESASRGMGTESDHHAAPTDAVAFQASEEYARITSPQPAGQKAHSFKSEIIGPDGEKTIHVDDPEHPEYRSFGDEPVDDAEDHGYTAPILAADEVGKHGSPYIQQPAVHPPPERHGSAFEMDSPRSRPTSRSGSRSNSRPTSMYLSNNSQDFESTSLDDVKEYEPLFKDEAKKEKEKQKRAEESKARHHFPSKDIWEDAPNSVHFTTEVSTPDLSEQNRRKSSSAKDRPNTPAHLFAQKQEELAEREVHKHAPTFLPLSEQHSKPTWSRRPALGDKKPSSGHRFPSKDIWEDAPESHLQEAEIEQDEEESKPKETEPEETKPEVQSQSVKSPETSAAPSLPERPKPKQTPSDDGVRSRPPVSDKPKPQIPPRPSKTGSGDSKDGEFSKPKPPVPSRPVGGKIAALQAGFMSDLNKRLQLGPQAPKKEEPAPQENLEEEKEKAPLADARKGRARGPQRRAPAKSPAGEPEVAKASVPTLSFCTPQTFWSIDPEGDLSVSGTSEDKVVEEVEQTKEVPPSEPIEAEEPKTVEEPEPVEEPKSVDPPAVESQEAPAQEEPTKTETLESPESPKEQKTLVANTAGESILETTVEQKGEKVEPVDVQDTPKA